MNYMKLFSAAIVSTVAVGTLLPAISVEAAFKDVKSDSEQAKAINSLASRQIISGYADGTFKPNAAVTRSQVSKIIARHLGNDGEYLWDVEFQDVPKSHPNYEYITYLANMGVFNAENTNFKPNNNLTRAQLAKVLVEAYDLSYGIDTSKVLPFKDVKSDEQKHYINILYQLGITTGKTATTFGVNDPVSRGNLAVFVKRTEDYLARTRITFRSKDFNAPYIYGNVLRDESDKDSLIYLSEFALTVEEKERVFIANKPGTSYIYIGRVTEDFTLEKADVYKIVVTESNGKLNITKTKLNRKYIPE